MKAPHGGLVQAYLHVDKSGFHQNRSCIDELESERALQAS